MSLMLKNYITKLSEPQIKHFEQLEILYKEWNEKINIISRKDIIHLVEKHFLHSLIISEYIDFSDATNIVDIGTGGGFPGIPLAILYPNVQFFLVDSIQKKILVVEEICKKLNLTNVHPLCERIENIATNKFDIVLSRATAPLSDLIQWSKMCLNRKSVSKYSGLVCLKGGNLEQEIAFTKTHPKIFAIEKKISLEYYKEKFILYVPKNQILTNF